MISPLQPSSVPCTSLSAFRVQATESVRCLRGIKVGENYASLKRIGERIETESDQDKRMCTNIRHANERKQPGGGAAISGEVLGSGEAEPASAGRVREGAGSALLSTILPTFYTSGGGILRQQSSERACGGY
jgi:hypothetical protein